MQSRIRLKFPNGFLFQKWQKETAAFTASRPFRFSTDKRKSIQNHANHAYFK